MAVDIRITTSIICTDASRNNKTSQTPYSLLKVEHVRITAVKGRFKATEYIAEG